MRAATISCSIATRVDESELSIPQCKFCSRLWSTDWESLSDDEESMEEENNIHDPDWTPEIMILEPTTTDNEDEDSDTDFTEMYCNRYYLFFIFSMY